MTSWLMQKHISTANASPHGPPLPPLPHFTQELAPPTHPSLLTGWPFFFFPFTVKSGQNRRSVTALSSICPRASVGDPAPPAPPPAAADGVLVGGAGTEGMLVVAQNIILH